MDIERSQPEPLEYAAARRAGRRLTRGLIVTLLGAAIASIGLAVFFGAHEITGDDYDVLPADHARLHELLWAALGIALLLAGSLIAAVGLTSWCRGKRDNQPLQRKLRRS